MRWWKWLGLAGMAGVAATGVVVVRNERQRRSYTPDDVRARLHERAGLLDEAEAAAVRAVEPASDDGPPPHKGRKLFRR